MARFDRLTVYNTILADGLVPLFYHADLDTAKNAAAALAEGGGHVLEFTNRGDFALEVFTPVIKACAASHPNLIIGVGSVEDAPTAAMYIANGANFVVGPTFNEEVARLCNRRKIPYMPGCGSVNEVALAEEFGAEIVKIFPGDSVGGPGFIKAPWTRIMPTGGVEPTEESLRKWFGAGIVACGIGSNLITKELLKAKDYKGIEENVRKTIDLVKKIKAALKK